ncbi:MAG: M28 family peptidase [Bacteroidales bacterium]|nr:M28 family peptidase [Bacteroidales bacterium]
MDKVNELKYDSIYQKLQKFESLGIKQVGTPALDVTAEWIIAQHQLYGYSGIEVDSFFYGPNHVYNIIVTKPGMVYPDTYLIVDGHYDTYNGPGVNDNGSGTAIVLEVARLMANVETKYSIKFIHFTIEELGLIGSYHYVDSIVIPQQMDIRLVFNIDEVGGVAGEVNNTITCERDEWAPNSNNAASAAFTDTLATLTEQYSDLNTQIYYAYGSDYVPFMLNGYVVTGFYESNESPYPHSINDSLSNLDPEYVFQVARASLAAIIYFAGNIDIASDQKEFISQIDLNISPNPFGQHFEITNPLNETIQIRLFDLAGKLMFKSTVQEFSSATIKPVLKPGIYLINIINTDGLILYEGKAIKK